MRRNPRNPHQELQSIGPITQQAADDQIAKILASKNAHDHHEKTAAEVLEAMDSERREEILQVAAEEGIDLVGEEKPVSSNDEQIKVLNIQKEGEAHFQEQIKALRALGHPPLRRFCFICVCRIFSYYEPQFRRNTTRVKLYPLLFVILL